ncbi:hypothetical protein [Hydrogenophaga sp. 5NK40-0174]|uniref:hypothetical protein n=1 Tax=Hydrogenophaga sp. 5NK40-0174 TaxID=3127649 RepID=UPI00310B9206
MAQQRQAFLSVAAWRQADAWLAWLLLGWLGQEVSWSFASGVWPVVLWWATRSVVPTTALPGRLQAHPLRPMAVACTTLILVALAWRGPSGHALACLMLGAVSWGVWSASLRPPEESPLPTLSGQAMGLMMGSMWLAGQWCAAGGSNWQLTEIVAWHLALMAGMPLIVTPLLAFWHGRAHARVHPKQLSMASILVLLTGCTLLAWSSQPVWHLGGTFLVVAAWAVAPSSGTVHVFPGRLWAGPLLLLAVGWWSPTLGPQALQAAWCALALFSLIPLLQRTPSMSTSHPTHPQHPTRPAGAAHWRDAS